MQLQVGFETIEITNTNLRCIQKNVYNREVDEWDYRIIDAVFSKFVNDNKEEK